METIRATRLRDLKVGTEGQAGAENTASFVIEVEDGRRLTVEVPPEGAFDTITALIAGFAYALRNGWDLQASIPIGAWRLEVVPGPVPQPVIHAYLPNAENAALPLRIEREHIRPLGEYLRQFADDLDRLPTAPLAPGSNARN